MKKSDAATFLVALVLACSLTPARSYAQSLEAHESGTGMGTVTHWETTWGSYDRDYHQTKKIRIIARDVSRQSPDGEVRVYFIGNKLPQGDLFIYNHAILKVHFGGNIEVKDEIDAPSLFRNETHYNLSRRHYSTGAGMEGWIIEGRVGSRVFGTAASSQNLLAIAKSDALPKMIAAAGIRQPQRGTESSSPPAIQPTSPAPSVSQNQSPPVVSTAVVNRRVQAQTPRGEIMIPSGAQVRVLGREGENLQISYKGWTVTIPASATDLK